MTARITTLTAYRERMLCTSCNKDGWQCELRSGHDGDHAGGDYTWSDNEADEERWLQNCVLNVLLYAEGERFPLREVAKRAGLPRRLVRGLLVWLRREQLADCRNGLWGA